LDRACAVFSAEEVDVAFPHAASPCFGPGHRSGRRSDLLISPPEASEIAFACSAGARPFLCSQYQTVAWLTPRRRANLDWPPARAIARSSACPNGPRAVADGVSSMRSEIVAPC